jgi:membrane protein YdbS with pleckstrin-like domain
MYTEEEKQFLEYWEQRRSGKKSSFRQLVLGLPLGVLLVVAIFVNFFSGWYKRADEMLHSNASLVLVVLVAALLIVAFVVVFSVHHKWDMNEQRYKELRSRKDQP